MTRGSPVCLSAVLRSRSGAGNPDGGFMHLLVEEVEESAFSTQTDAGPDPTGGGIRAFQGKNSRTAQAAARKPVRSAHRAAGTAYRVRVMPTAPK